MFVCALRHTLCSILTLFALHCSLSVSASHSGRVCTCVSILPSPSHSAWLVGWFRWLRQRHSCAPTVTHTHLCKYVHYVSIRFRWLFDLWCCVFGLLSHRSTDAFFSLWYTHVSYSVFVFSTGFFFIRIRLHLDLLLCPSILWLLRKCWLYLSVLRFGSKRFKYMQQELISW